MAKGKTLFTYKVIIPYTESSNPRKPFKIEYVVEAPDRDNALQKAEREFFAYTGYNNAAWVRMPDRTGIRIWKLLPDLPQTAQTIDELVGMLVTEDQDVIYNTLKKLCDLEDSSAASRVQPFITNPNPDLAAIAIEGLGRMGDRAYLQPLMDLYPQQSDPRIKATILSSISRLAKQNDELHDILAAALGDEDGRVRANAVEVIDHLRLASAAKLLVPLLSDEDNRVRANVLKALWATHDREALMKSLKAMMEDANRWMRASAAFVLQHIDVEGRLELLCKLSRDPDTDVFRASWRALLSLAGHECIPYWLDYLFRHQEEDLPQVMEKVETLGSDAAEPLLKMIARHDELSPLAQRFFDRLEDRAWEEEGWWSWLQLKKKRFFSPPKT